MTRLNIWLSLLVMTTAWCAFSVTADAEPWLANRFAQNCVACHAPGRIDVSMMSRRCTVSCKSCHINPNGGGLRNANGKWFESRWLSSWTPSSWELAKPKPARLADQAYEQQKLESYLKGTSDPDKAKNLSEVGPPMKTADGPVDEKDFTAENSAYENTTENDRTKFMMTVPKGDPLRESMLSPMAAGVDLRYLYFMRTINGHTNSYSVPMAADVGAQIKPIKHVSAVIEARFANGPNANSQSYSNFNDVFTTQPSVRSGYLMVDDLPLNSWATYGIIQPMFGNNNPDHTSLLNSLTYGVDQSMISVYNAFSVGMAPKMSQFVSPLLQLHLISPLDNGNYSQDSGYIANLAGYFTPFNLSVLFSYWNTTSTSTNESRREMESISVGGTYLRWTTVVDANHVRRNTPNGGMDTGSVASLENKFRLWRENYLELNYSWANTAADLSFGESAEYFVGLRSFPIAGLDLELLWSQLRNSPFSNDTKIAGQIHFFF